MLHEMALLRKEATQERIQHTGAMEDLERQVGSLDAACQALLEASRLKAIKDRSILKKQHSAFQKLGAANKLTHSFAAAKSNKALAEILHEVIRETGSRTVDGLIANLLANDDLNHSRQLHVLELHDEAKAIEEELASIQTEISQIKAAASDEASARIIAESKVQK
jgi:hypothetical protein